MSADIMQELARELDKSLNGGAKATDRENGFVLLVFPFNAPKGARTNYVSNGQREDIVTALKEIVARFEGGVIDTDTIQ
jgi:TolB-like protein